MMHKGKGQKICRMKNGYASVWGISQTGKEDSGKGNKPVSRRRKKQEAEIQRDQGKSEQTGEKARRVCIFLSVSF